MVKCRDEFHIPLLDGLSKLADDITFGTHFERIPLGIFGVPHTESVVMHRHRARKASAGLLKKIRPFLGVELLAGEHGNEILVTKFLERTIGLFLVFSLRPIR